MGAGGVIVPPDSYFEEIGKILKKYDIIAISDEVICGFGRTGEWFGSQTLGMSPNSISMAKQLTAVYAPLSAVAIDNEMANVIEEHTGTLGTFGHGFTYGGHPVGCAVGIKALEIYQERNILQNVRNLSSIFKSKLNSFSDHDIVGEARALGLMGALELTPNKTPAPFKEPGKVGAKMASELLNKGSWIANKTIDKVNKYLEKGDQILFFLNRRGFSPFVICKKCFKKFQCPNCELSLNYHKKLNKLLCHYCGHKSSLKRMCKDNSLCDLFFCGPGVERIYSELKKIYPKKNIQIFSSDTLKKKELTNKLLKSVEEKKIDILIGTQLLSKGFHFPRLNCIVVVDGNFSSHG